MLLNTTSVFLEHYARRVTVKLVNVQYLTDSSQPKQASASTGAAGISICRA